MQDWMRFMGMSWGIGGIVLIMGSGIMGLISNPQIPKLGPMHLSLIFAFCFLFFCWKLRGDSIWRLGLRSGICSGALTLIIGICFPGGIYLGELARNLGMEMLIISLAICTVFGGLIQNWIRSL